MFEELFGVTVTTKGLRYVRLGEEYRTSEKLFVKLLRR